MNLYNYRNIHRLLVISILFCGLVSDAFATEYQQSGLVISKIRSVGDYQGTTFDNTVELWFTTSLVWPAGSPCTSTFRIEIDAKNKHLVSAAYLAFALGKKLDINVDDTLPVRYGICEVSYIDINQ